jgi:hypothetical protein
MFVLENVEFGIAGSHAFMHCIYGYLHERNILKFEQFFCVLRAEGKYERDVWMWSAIK